MAFYELVSVWNGNRLAEYVSEAEAMQAILAVVKRQGAEGLDGLGLAFVRDDGSGDVIAEGPELADRLPVTA